MTARLPVLTVIAAMLLALAGGVGAQVTPQFSPPCTPYPACLSGGGGGGGSSETCAQTYSGVQSNPQEYGADMQACCSETPSDSTCVGYLTVSNTTTCGNPCSPPSNAVYYGGRVVRYAGWGAGAVVDAYLDPALGTYSFPNGTTSRAAPGDIQTALNAAASQLGITLQFVSSPPANGYSVLLGSASECAGGADAAESAGCTDGTVYDATGRTQAAATYVEFGSWSTGSQPLTNDFDAELASFATHEFLHSDGMADDYQAACLTTTVMRYDTPPPSDIQPQPDPLPSGDICAATDGAEDGPGSGGGGARVPGFDLPRYDRCIRIGESVGFVQRDQRLGQRLGVSATPTFFVNGRRYVGIASRAALPSAIAAALGGPRRAARSGAKRAISKATWH